MKLNFVKIKNGIMQWKQIEKKNGKTFMRIKRRLNPILAVRNGSVQL